VSYLKYLQLAEFFYPFLQTDIAGVYVAIE